MGENPAEQILADLPSDCHPDTRWRWIQRAYLLDRDGQTCQACNDPMHAGDLTIDHVVPRSRGGTDHPINLQLLHYECNVAKSDDPPPGPVRDLIRPVMEAEPWQRAWQKLAALG